MSAQPLSARTAPRRPLGTAAGTRRPPAGPGRAQVLPAPSSPYERKRRPLGDPSPLACTIAKASLEAVHGSSALDALTRWIDPTVRLQLSKQQSIARRAGQSGVGNAQVLRARVCRVSATAAEVSVVAGWGDRVHAIALRMEDRRGRWVATVIEVG
ncbi:Rv3235 family protein [Demequina capsici]|uniref:Rv3235 family protein n=1 Tax=Demequina capsici TaxID=3075620 RepID=A0AA96J655_9MICO|nr:MULTISPECIES: Rv3235 family protein [unclassified Demequina]WNM23862.1 Rv3235 family protein [Demequina sp. OYTSA14]WNM26701.1 Rv3235 family protein [Demequina sp. PMTSA13]